MIFSNLFQPKYKHKDPLVRIRAIDTLSPDQQEHKSILHELAFNDSDGRVSVAALNKLNNFDLWWKMVEIAKDHRVSKHAKNKVEAALLGNGDITISEKTRKSFIMECKNNALLDLLLQKNAINEEDTEQFISVLKKLNRPQLSLRTLISTANENLRDVLFADIREASELNKIIKKAKSPDLVNMAKQRLMAMQEAKQKPVILEKEVKLLLSRLLALTEEADYQKFDRVKQELVTAYEEKKLQFSVFEPEVAESFEQKFAEITQKLDKKAQVLRGEWDAQKELERTSEALQSASETCEKVLLQVSEALSSHAAEITLGELEQFNQALTQAESDLNQMLHAKLTEQEHIGIERLINKLMVSRTNLDALPALQQALAQANELIVQFKALNLPDDVSQIDAAYLYLDEVKERWQNLKSGYEHIWPEDLRLQWQNHTREWQKAIKGLRETLHESVNNVRGRLNGIARAIDQGRFKNAMRNYEKVRNDYINLPEEQQARLNRQFDKVKAQIENLKDWQAYIATPKKPEILRELEQLVFSPLDPEQQAERVKDLRKEWNSLGVVESETDEALNKAFNMACEEAFKPCREFYAEQEKQRETNLQEKQALLTELNAQRDTDPVSLSKALRQLQNKWKLIGGVDYKVLDGLNQQYQEVVDPIKAKVNQFHQENAERKKALLQKAEALLQLEDWKEATETAKQIQDNWKKIEFAGQRLENKLWSEFRAINDKIFAKRESAMQAQSDSAIESIAEHLTALKAKAELVEESRSRSELEGLLNDVVLNTLQALQEFPKKLNAEAFAYGQAMRKKIEEKLLYLGDSQRSEQYEQVFAMLNQWTGSQAPDGAADLPNYWRQAFHTADISGQGVMAFDRRQLVLLMEILTNKESPSSEADSRKAMQLQLMTLKLQDGVSLEMDDLLRAWIARGALTEEDKVLIARIKTLY